MRLCNLQMICLSLASLLVVAAPVVHAQDRPNLVVVTSSNTSKNKLLVYSPTGSLLQTVPTQGQGGASGNAGGIETNGTLIAVVNYGSRSVSVFEHEFTGFHVTQVINAASNPLSVAFSADHLYILGTTTVESHRLYGSYVSSGADGVTTLLKADGSAAQVGVLPNQLIITEKSNMIETVTLSDGQVTGVASAVQNIPSNVNAPFGLITRGNDAYVTIAHANEISLVRNDDVLTVTSSGNQQAPCWLALAGPFLYSSNSPSMTVSRFAVYGQKIVQDLAVAATFNGLPTDIAAADQMVVVIDGNGPVSHLSFFSRDEDGNLTTQNVVTIKSAANGVAFVTVENYQ